MQPAEDAELIDTTDLEVDDVVSRIEELIRVRSLGDVVTLQDTTWRLGRVYMGWPTRWVTRARAYGRERVPATGGLVYAVNHMHWLDIPIVGAHLAAQRELRREVRGARLPGLRPVRRLARHDRGPARRSPTVTRCG